MAEIPLHDSLKYECPWLTSTAMVHETSTSTYSAYFLFPKIRVSFHISSKLVGARELIQSSAFNSDSLSFMCVTKEGYQWQEVDRCENENFNNNNKKK